jgi:galactokinase
VDEAIVPGEPRWANHCRDVAALLIERGLPIRGADVLVESGLPLGVGLGSSSVLEVGTAKALPAAVAFQQIGPNIEGLCDHCSGEGLTGVVEPGPCGRI